MNLSLLKNSMIKKKIKINLIQTELNNMRRPTKLDLFTFFPQNQSDVIQENSFIHVLISIQCVFGIF